MHKECLNKCIENFALNSEKNKLKHVKMCSQDSFGLIDSFHIVSAHAPNSLLPRYLREITREGATFIRLPYITQWNMEKE